MLHRIDAAQLQDLAFGEIGECSPVVVLPGDRVVAALHVHAHEAVETHGLAARGLGADFDHPLDFTPRFERHLRVLLQLLARHLRVAEVVADDEQTRAGGDVERE